MKIRSVYICLLMVLLLLPAQGRGEDVPFKICLLTHHTLALGDYWTTFAASRDGRFQEENRITSLYWRSPPAFCAIKAVEIIVFDKLFRFIYKKSKLLGILSVAVFAAFRYIAFRDNLQVIRR